MSIQGCGLPWCYVCFCVIANFASGGLTANLGIDWYANLIYSLYGNGNVLIYLCVWHFGLMWSDLFGCFGLWWGKTDIVGCPSYEALDLRKKERKERKRKR